MFLIPFVEESEEVQQIVSRVVAAEVVDELLVHFDLVILRLGIRIINGNDAEEFIVGAGGNLGLLLSSDSIKKVSENAFADLASGGQHRIIYYRVWLNNSKIDAEKVIARWLRQLAGFGELCFTEVFH